VADYEAEPAAKRATRVVVLATAAVLVAYDLFVYRLVGGAVTISTVVGEWLAASLWVVAAMGLLVGHFLGSVPTGTPGDWLRFVVLAGGVVAGYLLTVL
jgi:hypothetical protein